MKQETYDSLMINPVIAAIKDEEGKEKCIHYEDLQLVFVLYGSVVTIVDIVRDLKAAGKCVFVHMDLISGLSSKDDAVNFIAEYTDADGIISTRPEQLKRGQELGLTTVLRIFAIDSRSLSKAGSKHYAEHADMIEVLPGVIPKVISNLTGQIRIPLVAGGLISDKEDVMAALDAGAVAISSTSEQVWNM